MTRLATRAVDVAVQKISPFWLSPLARLDDQCETAGEKALVSPPTSPRQLIDSTLEMAMLGEARRLKYEQAVDRGRDPRMRPPPDAAHGDEQVVAAIRKRRFEVAVCVWGPASGAAPAAAAVASSTVSCGPDDSGFLVKMRLAATFGGHVVEHRLECAGSIVPDDARLVDLGIGEGCCLQLFPAEMP